MDKNEIYKERNELLTRLEEELNENMIAAKLAEPENDGEPAVLNVLFDEMMEGDSEAYGEFFFRPLVDEDDAVQYFGGVITLSDELSDEHLPTLYEAMSYINFILPTGSFAVDADHNFLIYRLSVPLPIALSGEALYEQINMTSGIAAAMADSFMSVLVQVAQGDLTLEDVRQYLGE